MGKRVFFTLDLYYNYDDKSLYMNYELLKNLKPKESSILEYLILNSNIKCSYELIYENNWGDLFFDPKPVTDALKGIRDFSNIKSSMIYKNDLHKLFKEDVIKTCRGEGLIIYKNRIKEVKDLSQKDDEPSDDDTPNTNKTTSLNDKYTDEQIIHEYSDEESLYSGPNPLDNYPIYPSSMILYEDFKQYETYYERVEPLEKIETIMKSYSDQHRIVIIGGMGGMGKTELAKAYAYKHYILNESQTSYEKKYDNEYLFIYNNNIDEIRDNISSTVENTNTEKTLIILDNLDVRFEDGFEIILDSILSIASGADLIITTRNNIVSGKYYISFLQLMDYSNIDECLAIFRNNYEQENDFGNKPLLSEQEIPYLIDIFNHIGLNLLFIKLLAIQARENDGAISIKDYYDAIISSSSKIQNVFDNGVELDTFEHNGKIFNSSPYNILKYVLFENRLTKVHFSDDDIATLIVLSLNSPNLVPLSNLCLEIGKSQTAFKSIHNKLVKLGWLNISFLSVDTISGQKAVRMAHYSIHPLLSQLILDNINMLYNDSKKIDETIEKITKGMLALPYSCLIWQRYAFSTIITYIKNSRLKALFELILHLFLNHNVLRYKKLTDLELKNVIPFIEYDPSYVRYALYALSGKFERKNIELFKIDIQPTVYKHNPDVLLFKPVLDGTLKNIIIPEKIAGGKPITKIPDYWMMGYPKEFSITFSKNITFIGKRSFYRSRLTGELKLPPNIKRIEEGAFGYCGELSGILDLPNSLDYLGEACFINDNISHVKFSNSLKSILKNTFRCCENLTSVHFPNELTRIESDAFRDCIKLTGDINISSSIEYIDIDAFCGCHNISSINVQNQNYKIDPRIIGRAHDSDFNIIAEENRFKEWYDTNCSTLNISINYDHSVKLDIPQNSEIIKKGDYTGFYNLNDPLKIPDSIKTIDDYAFFCCCNMSGNIVFPDNITSIGEFSFYYCRSLKGDLNIPSSISTIKPFTFFDCFGLDGTLSLHNGLQIIDDSAFSGCIGLRGDLIIPSAVKFIGPAAFYSCYSFSGKLVLSENLESIEEQTFYNCNGLSGELKLPQNLKYIGDEAFYNCNGLSGKLILPESLKTIGAFAFYKCSFNEEIIFHKDFEYIGRYSLVGNNFSAITFLNPNTVFPDDYITNGTIIKGYKGSTAEFYALTYGYDFEYLN